MIEEVEAEAVLQMVNEERGRLRGRATRDHQGSVIEVRARRRRDGAAVLCYSYEGVRLERSVLLLLICPQTACERSQSAKKAWAARDPVLPALERRPLTGLRSADRVIARLFQETPVQYAGKLCVARPAAFAVLTECPVHAHDPTLLKMSGWDLFLDGEYLAGGLLHASEEGVISPRFESVEAATTWLRCTHSPSKAAEN